MNDFRTGKDPSNPDCALAPERAVQSAPNNTLKLARELSPRRSTSEAHDIPGLVAEQLAHYGIDSKTEMGAALGRLAEHVYRANIELHQLWQLTTQQLSSL